MYKTVLPEDDLYEAMLEHIVRDEAGHAVCLSDEAAPEEWELFKTYIKPDDDADLRIRCF